MADLSITVAIPTIPRRRQMLARAVQSAVGQQWPATALSIAVDTAREGAWVTRGRAAAAVKTPWTAFLDDDDEFHPDHLRLLAQAAVDTGADYVYSWPEVIGGTNPLAGEHEQWRPGLQTTITVLVRTELAQLGFKPPVDGQLVGPNPAGEDYTWSLECHEAGAKFHHLVGHRTWNWHHHGGNLSGRPSPWG